MSNGAPGLAILERGPPDRGGLDGLSLAKAIAEGFIKVATFRTLELAIDFNAAVEQFKIKEHLRDQLLRAASSIALNLAEGNAKFSVKEKKRFYQTAYGSLKECQTIFRLLPNKSDDLEKLASHLGASLFKLIQSNIRPLQHTES